jgi:hypothetical protein
MATIQSIEKFGKEEAKSTLKVSKPEGANFQIDYSTEDPNVHITFVFSPDSLKTELGKKDMTDQEALAELEKLKQGELDSLIEKKLHFARVTAKYIPPNA